jgi:RND family efflux transporter MFP subunit
MNYLVMVAISVLLVSCAKESAGRQTPPPAATPIPVHAINASAVKWSGSYEATGTVRARTLTTISSKVTGYVQQVSIAEGDHVTHGQLLITLETRDLDAKYRSAEIARAEVQTNTPEADYAITGAKASLDLAQATFRRIEDLAAKKSVSTQEYDEASERLKAAQSAYDIAKSRRAQIDARLAQADQEIHSAGIARDYAKIAAPFAGVVTSKTVDPGNLATPGAPLLTIEQDGPYRLEASVEESRLSSVRSGQGVEVVLDALNRKLSGHVSEIVPAVDSKSHAYIVKIDLPGVAQLRSGMFGRVRFPLGPRDVLAIPHAAVIERGQLQSIFVAENGTAIMRLVTLGDREGDGVEVLSGLNPGELVIVPIPAGLHDGVAIRQ